MSKYLVSVGEVKGKYSYFVCFDCVDLQEVIEIFSEMTLEDIKDYKLVVGANTLNEASWDERGEASLRGCRRRVCITCCR